VSLSGAGGRCFGELVALGLEREPLFERFERPRHDAVDVDAQPRQRVREDRASLLGPPAIGTTSSRIVFTQTLLATHPQILIIK
jgi:hypothetical protein